MNKAAKADRLQATSWFGVNVTEVMIPLAITGQFLLLLL